MSLITVLLTIAVIGLIAFLIVKFVPMPPNFQTVIYVVTGIVVLLYVLQAFGLIGGGVGSVKVPTVG